MFTIVVEVLFIFFLTVLNGVFAMSETAIVASRKARLQQWANEGNTKAQAALGLANAPREFLSTVQIGITLVGVLAGAFGGATIAGQLAVYLNAFPLLAPYSDAIAIGLVVLGITYLSLVVGELAPKHIALNNAERVASFVAAPMRVLSKITSPFVHLLSFSTDVLLRLLRVRASAGSPISEEEINILIKQGTRAGVFELAEQNMVENVFRLGARTIGALMTPRTKVVALLVSDTPEVVRRKITQSGHSQFPLCEENLDNIVGVVQARDLLTQALAGYRMDIRAVAYEPLCIPESTPALKALELFRKSGKRIALVLDEHGVFQGLVTVNDIMESVVGEISQFAKPKAVQRRDGSWLVDGLMPLDEFKSIFRLGSLPDEKKGAYHTLGGFVMMHLRHIPSAGEWFQIGPLRFEIMDMDGLRVDKVLVVSPQQNSSAKQFAHTVNGDQP